MLEFRIEGLEKGFFVVPVTSCDRLWQRWHEKLFLFNLVSKNKLLPKFALFWLIFNLFLLLLNNIFLSIIILNFKYSSFKGILDYCLIIIIK